MNKKIQNCLEKTEIIMLRDFGEKYGVRASFNVYYFPRYDRWIVTYDETVENLDLTIQDEHHIECWKARYLTKQGIEENVYLIPERELPICLSELEIMKCTEQIKF